MLTEFGVEIRTLRLQKRLRLKDMASLLKRSPAFLSAVETGRKAVPQGLVDEIAQALELDDVTTARLRKACLSSLKAIKLNVEDEDVPKQELAVRFARRFSSLSDAEVKHLLKVLK
jgi:HTH-type transcriptional regulator, competence development regulator